MKKILFVFFLMFLFNSNAIAVEAIKIGFVSVEKILTEAPQVKAVNDVMTARFGSKKEDLQKEEKTIKSMQEEYKRNELVMTEDKLAELKNKIISRIRAYKQSEVKLSQEVATMRNQELATLQQVVQEIIRDIAKTDNFDLVLSEGVVFASDKLNITDKVLTRMKEAFEKDKKAK